MDVALVHLLDAGAVCDEWIRAVQLLQKAQMGVLDVGMNVVLEDDDVRVIESAVRVLAGKEGSEGDLGAGGGVLRGREGSSEDSGDAGDSYHGPLAERSHGGVGKEETCDRPNWTQL